MHIIKYGARGAEVAELQSALNRHGANIAEDGIFGEATEQALIRFQAANGLMADGRCGDATRAALAGRPTKSLTEADIAQAAALLEVEPAAVKAVIQVESAGAGYLKEPQQRVKILFERHIFARLLKERDSAAYDKACREAPHICQNAPGGYKGGAAEYPRLARAMMYHHETAMEAASWGLFQIMGFNYKQAGFDSIHAFVDAMKESEGQQLTAFARFVKADKAMHAALKKHDWAAFAKRYNGPAYQKNNYDAKLANAYRRYQELAGQAA